MWFSKPQHERKVLLFWEDSAPTVYRKVKSNGTIIMIFINDPHNIIRIQLSVGHVMNVDWKNKQWPNNYMAIILQYKHQLIIN